MNLADAVSGRAGLESIRWLLVGPEPRELVRRELSALSSAPEMLGARRLLYAKFRVKPDVKLSAYYDVDIADNGSGGRTRAIAVMWKPKWREKGVAASWETPEVTEMEAQALRAGLAEPFHRLTARVPAAGLYIQVSPLDVSFPQLVRISDPEYVGKMLARAKVPVDGLQGDTVDGRYTVTSIKYQPGQRHLLRYDSTARGGGTVFVKAYKNGKGKRYFQVAIQTADWLPANLEGATCLRPLAYLPEDDAVLYPLLSGTPLHESLIHHENKSGEHLELAGRVLAVLHQAPHEMGGLSRKRSSLEAEVRDAERKSDYVPMLLPSAGPAIKALIDKARILYAKLPQESPTFVHGDFKAEHLWTTSRGITVIDFDASYLGDPAVDVGRFLADLWLWFDIWQQPGFTEARERFLAGYVAATLSERLTRARLFEALELIRSTGRRLSFFDEDWQSRVERLVSRASALLDGLEGASTPLHCMPTTSLAAERTQSE